MAPDSNILTINSGSSSIKFALYRMGRNEKVVFSGSVGGIGAGSGVFRVKDGAGKSLVDNSLNMPSHNEALREITDWLKSKTEANPFEAVGHRLVHGGSRFSQPHLITPQMMETLEELIPYAPDHLPYLPATTALLTAVSAELLSCSQPSVASTRGPPNRKSCECLRQAPSLSYALSALFLKLLARHVDCVPVGSILQAEKISLIYRAQNLCNCSLNYFILKHQYTYRS